MFEDVSCVSGVWILLLLVCVVWTGCRMPVPPEKLVRETEIGNAAETWKINTSEKSSVTLTNVVEGDMSALRAEYKLPSDTHGYVELIHGIDKEVDLRKHPITFMLKAEGRNHIDVKFTDSDGSVFGRKISLSENFKEWTRVVLDMTSVEYWWGGADGEFQQFRELTIAPAGQGEGTIWLARLGWLSEAVEPTLPPAGALLDPDRELPGCGVRQRRDKELTPENPLVLEWMKYVQDTTTPAKNLVGTLEDTNIQTFNNALVATAFLVKGERERAERILDFFANAIDRGNTEQFKQNLFYNGEARGFFQNAHPVIRDGEVFYYADEKSDRWMGDMVWLMYAYLYHDKLYGTDKYREIEDLIMDLVTSWFIDAPDGKGGYVQHGWRKGDVKLHENHGHPEGNIDCYALFRVLGMDEYARKVRTWLENHLHGNSLPLDLYTWRALAYAPEGAELLDIPDYDFRFRKTVEFNGKSIVGVYHSADASISNIWVDGVGHIACAYFAVGEEKRGNFYANQMDLMLVDRELGGRTLKGVPYVLNAQGGFEGFDIRVGSASPAAWYIFAKNRFNPMLQEMAK